MSITVTQEGASVIWFAVLLTRSTGTPWVHLYSSPHTPAHTDTYATFAAIECPANVGYAPISLTQPERNMTTSPIGAGSQFEYDTIQWDFTGAVTIYGYWIADATNNYSLWAEALTAPVVIPALGGALVMKPLAWLASQPDVNGIPCIAP